MLMMRRGAGERHVQPLPGRRGFRVGRGRARNGLRAQQQRQVAVVVAGHPARSHAPATRYHHAGT